MSTTINYSYQPITDLKPVGLHWIEASAGTGKTFTLSSIIVRLLLEQYLPKQIIATTFTRKAAAELKSRIRLRLQEVRLFLQSSAQLSETHLKEHITQQSDPLLQKILQDFSDRLPYALERTTLVLDQFDELFVGTLDSFTQKLLREFSFESGVIDKNTVTDHENNYITQIIHDNLRAWIEQRPQEIIDFLYQQKILRPASDFFRTIRESLNFPTAQWENENEPNSKEFMQVLHPFRDFAKIDFDALLALPAFEKLDGRSFKPTFEKLIKTQKSIDLSTLYDKDIIKNIQTYLEKINTGIKFNKSVDEADKLQFLQHPSISDCQKYFIKVNNFQSLIHQYERFLLYYLIKQTQSQLPQLLQSHQETTFNEQTQRLAQALTGENGEKFARLVHQRYPVILIDEFQDTSHSQDMILQKIWRENKRYEQGCIVMVGDDKQAIYGFRGGDILTYIKAREQTQKLLSTNFVHFYSLKQNHRSIKPLVEAVDAFFLKNIDFGEKVIYKPIEAGSRPHPDLVDNLQHNPKPLRFFYLKDKDDTQAFDQAEQVVFKIKQLLAQSEAGTLYFQNADGSKRPITVNDIAILSTKKKNLYAIEPLLLEANIPIYVENNTSIFEHILARDVLHFLSTILNPFQENKVKKLLLSKIFSFKVSELQELEKSNKLSEYMQKLANIRNIWMQRGFSIAWYKCLEEFNIWQNILRFSRHESERFITNFRHLSDLLIEHSEKISGMYSLFAWFEQQVNNPQTREWEIERRLSNDTGISLMTIHKSKGLEFKIVFLLSADHIPRNQTQNTDLIFSEDAESQRVITVQSENPHQIKQHDERTASEEHRLWYVALTRASHRLYLMMGTSSPTEAPKKPTNINYWLSEPFEHPQSALEEPISEAPSYYFPKQTANIELVAQPLPKHKFLPESRTSFSGLTHLKYQKSNEIPETTAHKTDDEALYDDFTQDEDLSIDLSPILPIQKHFPKGANAGLFLHNLFEYIRFSDAPEWQMNPEKEEQLFKEIKRRFKNGYQNIQDKLLEMYATIATPETNDQNLLLLLNDLKEWLELILNAPLNTGFKLSSLKDTDYQTELSFLLALKKEEFDHKALENLFAKYNYHLELNAKETAYYLNGEIDLVFFDGEKYHIADFKSNYLGENFQDYEENNLKQSMSKAQYWLQASFYLVALHRYLKQNLEQYDMNQHLGDAHYLYLRGMNGSPNQGILSWKPDNAFILELDALLGYTDKVACT